MGTAAAPQMQQRWELRTFVHSAVSNQQVEHLRSCPSCCCLALWLAVCVCICRAAATWQVLPCTGGPAGGREQDRQLPGQAFGQGCSALLQRC